MATVSSEDVDHRHPWRERSLETTVAGSGDESDFVVGLRPEESMKQQACWGRRGGGVGSEAGRVPAEAGERGNSRDGEAGGDSREGGLQHGSGA